MESLVYGLTNKFWENDWEKRYKLSPRAIRQYTPEQFNEACWGYFINSAYEGDCEFVQELYEDPNGWDIKDPPKIDINQTHPIGWVSALMLASKGGHSTVIEYLLGKGADPALKNVDGFNARDFALYEGHSDIVTLLDNAMKQSTRAFPKPPPASASYPKAQKQKTGEEPPTVTAGGKRTSSR